eukprot:385441_1
MRGCNYGDRCRFSHASPNSITYCANLLTHGECLNGNYCEYRHYNFTTPSQTKNKRRRKRKKNKNKNNSDKNEYNKSVSSEPKQHQVTDPNADIIPLLYKYDIYLGYGANQDIVYRMQFHSHQFKLKSKHKLNEKYFYNAKDIFSFLQRKYQFDEICRIGLWCDKMSQTLKTQRDWQQHINSLDKKNKLTNDEKNSVIKLIRNIINHYNNNWKNRKFSVPTFYNILTKQQLKLLVYGFFNELQLTISNIIPVDIINICVCFFIQKSSYEYTKNLKFRCSMYCYLHNTIVTCTDMYCNGIKKRYSYLIDEIGWKPKTGDHILQLKYIDNGIFIDKKCNNVGELLEETVNKPKFSICLQDRFHSVLESPESVYYEWRWNERPWPKYYNKPKNKWYMRDIVKGSLIDFKYDSWNGKISISSRGKNGKQGVERFRVKKNVGYHVSIRFRNHSKVKFQIIYYQ